MSPKFGLTRAIALWHAYDELCPYCTNPIKSFAELEIDHIIPECMLGRPDELNELLHKLGKPGLDLNSYLNLLPTHGRPCNRSKGDHLLPLASLFHYLDMASKHEQRVREEEGKLKRQSRTNKAFDTIIHLIEIGELGKDEAIAFISAIPTPRPIRRSEPLVLSFSVNVLELQESESLPEYAPDAPKLYDWLIGELQQALQTTGAMFSAIEDDRNGETVSIRYVSWMLDLDLLPVPLPLGWELLEVNPYSEIYPDANSEDLLAKGVAAKLAELTIDEFSSDPFPYKRCPQCTSPDLQRDSVQVQQDDVLFIVCTKCGWSTV